MVALVLTPAWWAFDVKLGPLAAESHDLVSIGPAPIPTPLRLARRGPAALACFSVLLPTFSRVCAQAEVVVCP